jgi:hypothetical protein
LQKFNNADTEKRVLQLLEQAQQPVSTDWIAFNLKICWSTARGLLLNMALKGQIKALKTTKSFVFSPKEAYYE